MKFVVVVMFSACVLMPSLAQSQQVPKDQCTLLTAADLEPVVGKGVVPETIGDEECRWQAPLGGYEMHIKRTNGAAELKDFQQFGMTKPVSPLKDIGDEAYISKSENAVAFRKGNVAVMVSPTGVRPTAPMKYQQGVVEIAKKLAAKLK